MRKLSAVAIAMLAALGAAAPAAADEEMVVLRFDMGSADSPLKDGFLRVTPETLYSPALGHGWVKKPSGAKDSTEHIFQYWGQKHRAADYVLGVDDMTVDCVNDPGSLQFSVDVPNGEYDVAVWAGNLATPLTHISVFANGQPLKKDFDSRTLWRLNMETQFGAHRLVRSRARVTDGKLRVEITGDTEAEEEYVEKPMGGAGVVNKLVARMAFTEVAVQGLVVHTSVSAAPLYVGGIPFRSRPPQEAEPFLRGFATGNYDDAVQQARSIDGRKWPLFKAEALLWLAGKLEVEDERELLAEAIRLLEGRAGDDRDGLVAQNLLWDAKLLSVAIKAFYDYAYTYTGLGLRQQVGRAEAMLAQLDDPEGPLYSKAKLYLARLTCMLDPMRWAWWYERGQDMFRELEKHFPDNKWVRLYLGDEWGPLKGQISPPRIWKGWEVPQYRDGIEAAPEWAVYMREEYARLIDLVEWWTDNRQLENGEIGGGWGDDVEFVPYWAFCGMLSEGPGEKVMAGTRKLVDGVWNSDAVNGDEGFSNVFTWVKPASELVGYSQPVMVGADYGNPRYVERAMKTTKFLRDFATGITSRGHRHFRSVYLNSSRLGDEPWMKIDAPLCFRPAFGTAALCWYSENPEAVAFITEWLDSWYEDSLRTDKGKPKWIFPAAVAFETEELGGPGAENWYDATRDGIDTSFSWPAYHHYLYNLCTAWYLRTGERKYLEPIRALVEIARHYLPEAKETLPEGTYPWFEQTVHPRYMKSARFQVPSALNVKLMTGTDEYDDYLRAEPTLGGGLAGISGYAKFLLDGNVDELAGTMEEGGRVLRSRWPFLTTEAGMTDRMVLPGFYDLFFASTGGNAAMLWCGLPFYAVTYEDTTKNFAALVHRQSDKALQLWMYSFLPEDREVGIKLWRLQVGGTYELNVGPDSDENWAIDDVRTTKQFVLEHRGDSVRFILPARELQVVEVKQIAAAATQRKSLPDLGISDEDVFWLNDREVAVRVHNIGSRAAENIRVSLFAIDGAAREKVGDAVISYLNAPLSLNPQTKVVSFPLDPERPEGALLVAIDPDDDIYEITERNNMLEFAAH